MVKPPLTLQLEDAKTQGFSSYSNTYPFNYLFGDKELLARQVGESYPDCSSVPSRTIDDTTALLNRIPLARSSVWLSWGILVKKGNIH